MPGCRPLPPKKIDNVVQHSKKIRSKIHCMQKSCRPGNKRYHGPWTWVKLCIAETKASHFKRKGTRGGLISKGECAQSEPGISFHVMVGSYHHQPPLSSSHYSTTYFHHQLLVINNLDVFSLYLSSNLLLVSFIPPLYLYRTMMICWYIYWKKIAKHQKLQNTVHQMIAI